MDVEKILKLVDAGFTKADIIKLANNEKATPKEEKPETPKEEKPETPKEEKPEAPKEDPAEKINAAIETALKPFQELYNNMAKLAVNPSMDSVEPKGLDGIIDNFFKGD